MTSHPLLAAGRGLWEEPTGALPRGGIVKRSINHALGLCAVGIVSCLLVLATSGQALADSKVGGGSGKHASSSSAGTTRPSAGGKAHVPHASGPDHSRGNAGTSGVPTSSQPLSNADQNSGGANGKCPGGPYCSTRDGSPSMNGNGGGKATGKPCAGCVGKADNKNPHGQYPNGSDHNAGYECDRNHGIGRTNPAHTGCTGSTTPEPGCVENPVTPGPDCGSTPPPSDCVENPVTPGPDCATVSTPTGCTPAAACLTVSPPVASGASAQVVAAAAPPAAVRATVLPETGSPAAMVAQLVASLALLAAGALVLSRRRRA